MVGIRVAGRNAIALATAMVVVVACGPGGSTSSVASTVTDGTASPAATASAIAPQDQLSQAPESPIATLPAPVAYDLQEYAVPDGAHPHDVSPAPDGGIWYTGQHNGTLGYLDSASGSIREIPLGPGSAPHGVITGPDGAAWITDGGQNAIVRVDAETDQVDVFLLPSDRPDANLNTAVFDVAGDLWFTGQSGIYGRLDPDTGRMDVWDDPEGRGPYGITATSDGSVWYVSLAGSHLGRLDPGTGDVTILEPPTARQGARRAWADSSDRIWVSEWEAGQVGVYDPSSEAWKEWRAPGDNPMIYAVFVDDRDQVWLTDFGANAIVRFDPSTEAFETFELPSADAAVRQLHGRRGEVWGAESGTDKLVVLRARSG